MVNKMIAIDTETTGLLRPEACELYLQPHIIEIYACKFDWDGNITDEIETFINPKLPVPETITKITGITQADVQNAPSFLKIYPELYEFFKGEDMVFAHNCPFDMGMIYNELRRHELEMKFPWPRYHMCTVELSYAIKNKRLKLGQLYELATGNKEIKDAHTAGGDVRAMVECIIWLKENGFLRGVA